MSVSVRINPTGRRLKVALVEADPQWRDRLTDFFAAQRDYVWLGACATPEELPQTLAGAAPDVVDRRLWLAGQGGRATGCWSRGGEGRRPTAVEGEPKPMRRRAGRSGEWWERAERVSL